MFLPTMKRSLGQKIFFAIVLTFEMETTNVKKVKNQPTLVWGGGVISADLIQSTPRLFFFTKCI
jgi:hypothetical protein